jgi:hypothetical protein
MRQRAFRSSAFSTHEATMKELDPLLKGLENIVWWAVNVLKCPYQIGDRVEVRTEEGLKQGVVTSFMMKRIDDMTFFFEVVGEDGEKLTPKRPCDIVRKVESPAGGGPPLAEGPGVV